ncbi:MAG TPA: PDDEXK nuclease domain-containing protein [Longimicrobium sp.]|jgi:predicted nuclease of restriction endonuclease-like (RecB) superfamily
MAGYGELLDDLRSRIRAAQVRAALAVNRELVLLYWQIGREILVRQDHAGWGAKVVDRLAADLRREFPDVRGLSRTNLLYMRAFAEAYPDEEIVQQLVGQIPWGHNTVLLNKLKKPEERLWYARAAVRHGWSRNVLVHQIESGLHRRQGRAITNFDSTLPAAQSDLAAELLKDPYHFDFLALAPAVAERGIERALLAHVRDFLLELGVGFALVGSQYPLEVGGQHYQLDLLFYHIRLRCFVVVELKVGAFKPEHAGKVNFYLSAVDDQLRQEGDRPSIGLILCKERNRVVAEYALRGTSKPIGVAEYRLIEDLPKRLQGSLPTPEQLEKELSGMGKPSREGPDASAGLPEGA